MKRVAHKGYTCLNVNAEYLLCRPRNFMRLMLELIAATLRAPRVAREIRRKITNNDTAIACIPIM